MPKKVSEPNAPVYKYFVSYLAQTDGWYSHLEGCAEVNLLEPIRSMQDIADIADILKERSEAPIRDIIIRYWRRFEQDE